MERIHAPRTFSRSALALIFGALLPWLAPGCNPVETPTITIGFQEPVDSGGTSFYFADPHSGGAAASIHLSEVSFGRLVEIFGRGADGERIPMASEVVIRQNLGTEAGRYTLGSNSITGQDFLVIERRVDTEPGRAEFLALAQGAVTGLDTVRVRGRDGTLFSMVPRNAALVLTFDDLLDPASVNARTVQLWTGDPPTTPMEARVFTSRFFGGEASGGRFFPTRVIVDLTVSEFERAIGDGTLPVNATGAPPSLAPGLANAELRFASELVPSIGMTAVLRNLAGNGNDTANNGPVDFTAPGRPVTRSFRTGGRPGLVQDPFNGFLKDEIAPSLVSGVAVELVGAPSQVPSVGFGGPEFILPLVRFHRAGCAYQPRIGDVLSQSGVVAEVTQPGAPLLSGEVSGMEVRVLAYPSQWSDATVWTQSAMGTATLETLFDPGLDGDRIQCFAFATPGSPPSSALPTAGISPSALLSLRFSEPMDTASLSAFDSITLTRVPVEGGTVPGSSDFVVGSLSAAIDRREVTFVPDQPLGHTRGTAETYYLGASGVDELFRPTDLAGNPLIEVPPIAVSLDANAADARTGGRVHRFSSIDEAAPVGPDFGNQVLLDVPRQRLRPRPLVHSQVVLDNSQPMMQRMRHRPGGAGLITPHSPYGSRMQTIWRYVDCGFAISDEQDQNIDVEGLQWSPSEGSVSFDSFQAFEIALAHSKWAPDEATTPGGALPAFPFSGLKPAFDGNVLQSSGGTGAGRRVVHDRSRGYVVSPGNVGLTSTGLPLIPFPMNVGVDFDDKRYFTWRDGDDRGRAVVSNGGAPVEPTAYAGVLGQLPPAIPYYRPGEAQTIGLPLLMEFRTFPDSGAIGSNAWDFNIVLNASARPFFRVFSTGGTNQSGTIVTVNPDASPTGSGGFDPTSMPPGAPTPGQDNVVHLGAIDYVTRVSHSNSVWFESDLAGSTDPQQRSYREPILEPRPEDQPSGTEVIVRFRGATQIRYWSDEHGFPSPTGDPNVVDNDGDFPGIDETPGIPDFMADASLLDIYGDYYNDREGFVNHDAAGQNPGIQFLGSSDEWRNDAASIDGARYYQVRLSFIGNAETGFAPDVAALAITWSGE